MNEVRLMQYLTRFTIVSAVAVFLVPRAAIAQGKDWSFDFRMRDSGTAGGEIVNGVTTGHAVVSNGRLRLDMKGKSLSIVPPGIPDDEVFIIVQNRGRLVTYLLPKTKQYIQSTPAEVTSRAQQMLQGMGMNIAVAGREPKVENLGKGPEILGYATVHYRVTTDISITLTILTQSITMGYGATEDRYLAPEVPDLPITPLGELRAIARSNDFGAGEFAKKLLAMEEKLPKAAELRAESHGTGTVNGDRASVTTIREITRIQRVNASPDLFVIPAGYKRIELPMLPMGMPMPGR